MWSLTIVFLFGLLCLISCQDYDELLKDVCFRKIYICGDHRSSVTGSSGRFETDPYQFGEICRKHKEYMACVDDAVFNNCNESISDLALMTLNNRISLKMFCTNLKWRKNYFSSVSCMNENYDKVQKDCEYEESIHVDDRPWWCLIQEPCEVIQRIFICTVQKMKGLCGSDAAEVFRRMQILKSDNMDVVCELRRENPKYCRYERQKRHIDADPQDRIASPSSLHEKSETEAMYNVVRAVPMDTVKNLELKQQGLSGIIDSDNVKLRKRLSIAEESPIRIENGFKLFKRFGFQEDFNPSSDVAEINRLRSLAENDHLSDIHRIGYQYKDTSYPGGYDNTGFIGPENLSKDQQKEFISTEPLYSGSTQFIIKQQDSDSQDHKNSEPPKKEKSRNDRKTETKEDPINNIEDKDGTTVFILRLKKNQEAALDEERFRREAEIARVNRDKRRNKEILRVAYGCKLNKLNEEARDLERKIEAVRKQIDETRQNQQRIVEEYEALERQRKEQHREFLQMLRENLLTREKEKAIYLKHEEL